MPAIVETDAKGFGKQAAIETTLNGTDSFVYNRGGILILRNPTAGALSPVIDGDGGSTLNNEGLGDVDVSSGYAVGSIAIGDVVVIRLDSIAAYLAGTIAVNTGTGLIAILLAPKI